VAAGRTAAIPAADRMAEGLPAAATHRLAMTIITNRFSPRFTPYLTHRQEASDGASCPPH